MNITLKLKKFIRHC